MPHISRFFTRRLRKLLMRVTPTLSLSINQNKNIPPSPPILLSIFFSKKMKANFFFNTSYGARLLLSPTGSQFFDLHGIYGSPFSYLFFL